MVTRTQLMVTRTQLMVTRPQLMREARSGAGPATGLPHGRGETAGNQ
jgi:hypothetical protein